MRLSRLRVSDFQGITQADVQLGALTMIYGPNGAAKSSLFDATLYALTGEQARGRTLGQMIRQGQKGLDVEAHLEGEERIELRRHRTMSAGQSYVDGGKVKDGAIEHHLAGAFGVDARAISAALRSGQILELGPAALQALLVDLSDSDLDERAIRDALGEDVIQAAMRSNLDLPVTMEAFPEAMRRAEAARQAAKRDLEKLEGDLARLPPAPRLSVVPDLASLRARRDAAVRAHAERDATIRQAQAAFTRAEVELVAAPDVEAPASPLPDLAAIRTRREAAIAADARRSGADEAKATAIRKRLEELRALPEITAADDTARQAAVDADWEAFQEHKRIGEAIAEADREIEQLRSRAGEEAVPADRLAELDAKLAAAREERDTAAKRARELEEEGKDKAALIDRLPTCGTIGGCPKLGIECPVPASELVQIGAQLAKAKDQVADAWQKARADIKGANADIASIEQARNAARISALVIERSALDAQLDSAESAWLAAHEEKERLIATKQRAEARRFIPELEADLARIEAAAALPAGEDLAALDAELAAAEAMAAQYADFEKRLALEERLQDAATALESAELVPPPDGVAAIDEEIQHAEAAVAGRAAATRREELETEIEGARQEIADADLVARTCGPKGAPATLLAQVAGGFLETANRTLEAIFPAARVDLETEGGLAIVTVIGSARLSPGQLSDGERTRFLYALQHAISRLAGVGLLLLDRSELIDAEAKKAVMRWVSQVTRNGTQVVMATSAPAPATAPPGLVAYAMSAGKSSPIPQAAAA